MSDSSNGRRGFFCAAITVALCAACSTDPEVVASSTGGDTLPDVTSKSQCRAGAYKGSFFTDEGSPLPLFGPMRFSLVQSRNREFLEIGPNTVLAGSDPTTHTEFTAKVVTGACVEGSYTTQLEEGVFSIFDAAGALFATWNFTGSIQGEYLEKPGVFYGTWNTTTPQALIGPVKGGWSAVYYADDADAGDP